MFTIFGNTGFIGRELKKYLLKEKYKVFTPKKKEIVFKRNLGKIIYCIGRDDWKTKPFENFYANLGLLIKILNNNKFSSICFLSSTRVYKYNKRNYANEDANIMVDPNNEDHFYNLLKLCAESFLVSNFRKKSKIIRLSNVVGINPKSPLILPTMIKHALKNKKFNFYISPNSKKDFIHIDEVLPMIVKIINSGKKNLYNLASGQNIKIKEIVDALGKYKKLRYRVIKNKIINEPKINIKQIQKEFNYKSNKKTFKNMQALINGFKKK